jgi:hypothetical protein
MDDASFDLPKYCKQTSGFVIDIDDTHAYTCVAERGHEPIPILL